MSFGLARGRQLDTSGVEVPADALPTLPDDLLARPEAARIDPRLWFPDPSLPFEIEIGPGKGSFLLSQAAADPGINLLGIEYAREFFSYAADRVRRRALTNVRMLCADAVAFLRWRCPSAIARTIHLYFSDPWPKRKHHKNRVVQDRFLAEAWRILVPGGDLRLVTDHAELWSWYQDHITRWTTPTTQGQGRSGGVAPGRLGEAEPLRDFYTLPDPPFALESFVPPPWAPEGELLGTNYERKFALTSDPDDPDAGPRVSSAFAAVLRKPL